MGKGVGSAWGGPEVGSRTWVLPGFMLGREALGKDTVRSHPPAPPLTDALCDVLGPLPPDAADPDQEGVARLQQVEQGGLQGAVPRAADGQGEGIPGLEHILDALLDLVHDLGVVDTRLTASLLPPPGGGRPGTEAESSVTYLVYLLVHVAQRLQSPGCHDARGQVGGAWPQQQPAGDGQRLAQGRRGGHQQRVGGHSPHPACRPVPQDRPGCGQCPEHFPAAPVLDNRAPQGTTVSRS